jgi:hypothetical protein
MYPEDVDPKSGLLLPRGEESDDAGQRTYDSLADPKGRTIRGLRGPGGILLHSPELSRGAAATWSGGRGSPPHQADSAKAP